MRLQLFIGVFAFALFGATAALGQAESCEGRAGDVPDMARANGAVDQNNPIEHIVIIMQENHSFDNYFGRLNQPHFYGDQLDGVTEDMWNATKKGKQVFAHHETTLCVDDPEHGWNAIHEEWNGGAM